MKHPLQAVANGQGRLMYMNLKMSQNIILYRALVFLISRGSKIEQNCSSICWIEILYNLKNAENWNYSFNESNIIQPEPWNSVRMIRVFGVIKSKCPVALGRKTRGVIHY